MMVPLFPWNQHEYQYPNMGSSGTASIEDVTQNEKQSWQKTTLASVIAAKTINRVSQLQTSQICLHVQHDLERQQT